MIVDCAAYEDGQRLPGRLSLEEAGGACGHDGRFVWLGVADPSADEMEATAAAFGLHELAVEDALKAHQLPKAEWYGDTLLVVLKPVRYLDSERIFETSELLVFVGPAFIVTVRHGERPLTEARARAERRPDLLKLGPVAVLYALLDHVVDDYEDAARGIDGDVQDVEQEVFSPERLNPAERIYKLERETIEFHRAVDPLLDALSALSRGDEQLVPQQLEHYVRDVRDHLQRVQSRIVGFRELLGSALQANLTQVAVRQNEDMRKISAWVAILAVPTCIAGIYGMNFDHMPELRWSYGYPAVLALILVICGALYWRFKRAGWL